MKEKINKAIEALKKEDDFFEKLSLIKYQLKSKIDEDWYDGINDDYSYRAKEASLEEAMSNPNGRITLIIETSIDGSDNALNGEVAKLNFKFAIQEPEEKQIAFIKKAIDMAYGERFE